MHAFPSLGNAEPDSLLADGGLGYARELGEVLVGKPVLLGLHEHFVGKGCAGIGRHIGKNRLFLLHELGHLLYELALYVRELEELLDAHALAKRLVHLELPLARGRTQEVDELVGGLFVKVLGKAQAVATLLQ